MEDHDVAALAFFLLEDMSWGGVLNQAILNRFGVGLDDYILNHVIKPRRGSVFVIPEEISAVPRLILGIIPKWDGGMDDEERSFKKCLWGMLEKADSAGVSSIAFPALGLRNKDYPFRKAARLAMGVFSSYPYQNLREVVIVCKSSEIFDAYDQ
ncbi:MAG: macro domain-containing protein [Alphaproteobacteria bacterium]|nr:macro domain-containing protein [Alphaproteobacteria bacterium]MCB1551082.1 macro domain-containing protein [Alphaproteobacteria bacterium]HPQ51483.1 macro domain-containing protein [Alphaproteobacteria bacterium]HRK97463.1 macro domain-containing protein [Alphaproteobacteria bacterium]